MGKLDGKVAIVTGAARGQGEAEARLFAQEGAAVALGDVLDAEGEQVAASINADGGKAFYQHLDVTSEDDWAAMVDRTVRELGGLHVLVNNAGIVAMGAIENTSLNDYMRVVTVNQVGTFLGVRAAIPALRDSGGGSIVNTSSIAGLEGVAGIGAYCASKWAIRGFTKVAALELGRDGIRVNSVHPGVIDTAMTDGLDEGAITHGLPIERVGRPEEVARLALWLASEDSSYSTGSEFIVDGGLTAGNAPPLPADR